MAVPTSFGATIVPTAGDHQEREQLRPFDVSPALTPAVSRDASAKDFYLDHAPSPQSPFYQHPPASHEVITPHSRRNSKDGKLTVATFEKDVESGNATPLSAIDDDNPFAKRHYVQQNKEDTMWPSKLTLKQQRRAEQSSKREKKGLRGCAPLRNKWSKLSKRNRILVQVGIALFIIGVAVAIGVGISISVKGTYYGPGGANKTVGE